MAIADITTDGTLSPRQTLIGDEILIPATLGRQLGPNLFHSFSEFNLTAQQTATFSGGTEIQHLIARVTGTTPSVINGTLRSTLPNADLYFLNPQGIQFGEHAQLDLQGAFYASTADQLLLAGGGQVNVAQPATSILTAAAPIEFGFLAASRATDIVLQQSNLQAATGHALQFISGGRLQLTDATLQANAGQLSLDAPQLQLDNSTLSAPIIRLSGDSLMLDNGSLLNSDAPDGDITLQAQRDITVAGINPNTGLGTTLLSSSGATMQITAPLLTVRDGGVIQTATFADRGAAGDMLINTQTLRVAGLSSLSALTLGTGTGGTIDVNSGEVVLTNNATLNARSVGLGNAGQIRLRADRLLLQDTSLISTTATQARGGNIELHLTESLTITRQSGITATAAGGDNGGNITVTAPSLNISNRSSITAASTASGDAGRIEVTTHLLTMDQSSIDSQALQAAGGNIVLQVQQRLWVRDSQITAQAQGGTRQDTGGNLLITAGDFIILDEALLLASAVFGDGGTIQLNTGNFLTTPGSVLDASSQFGLAGEVFISAPDVDLAEQLLPLSSHYWDASQFIRQQCAERLGHNLSNLFVTQYEILPIAPEWLADGWD